MLAPTPSAPAERLAAFREVAERLPGALLLAVDQSLHVRLLAGGALPLLRGRAREGESLASMLGEEAPPFVAGAFAGELTRGQLRFGDWVFDGWCSTHGDAGEAALATFFGVDVSSNVAEVTDLRERVEVLEWQAVALSSFGKALERANVLLWSVDDQGVFTMASGKALELLGSEADGIVGANAIERFGHTDFGAGIARALGGDESRAVVSPVLDVFLDTWFLPVTDVLTGERAGVIGLSLDVHSLVVKERELAHQLQVVAAQTETIRALATPVIHVWDGILCLPVVGAVDDARAQVMMTDLLDAVVREKARYVVLDLTGALGVDESTASHLLKVLQAARVLGTEGILCGLRPDMARTVATLEISFAGLSTFRTLKDALRHCMARLR